MNIWNQFQKSSPLEKGIAIAVLATLVGGSCLCGLIFLFDLSALWRREVSPTATSVIAVATLPPIESAPLPTAVVITGWQGEYFNNPTLEGEPVVVQNDEYINFDWGTNPPAPGVPAENFSVNWTISRDVPAGAYLFTIRHDNGARVWVNDQLIVDQWQPGPTRSIDAVVNVIAGVQNVRMEYFHTVGNAVAQLTVEHQQNFPDWKAEYFDNPSLSGNPIIVLNETAINYDWGPNSPVPGVVPSDNFSVRWSRLKTFENGTYLFRTYVEGGVRVLLDGQALIDNWLPDPLRTLEATSQVSVGQHGLTVEYFKQTGNGQIRFGSLKESEPGVPPVAVINGPTQAKVNQLVGFNALGTTVAANNTIVSNNWDFGDGTTASGIYVTHAYNAPGTYQVTLSVTDNQGLSDTTSQQIAIVTVQPTPAPDQPPLAIIEGPSQARVNDAVIFNGSASICLNACAGYSWNLGDGTIVNAVQIQHAYQTPGIYNVILTVTDQQGLVGTTSAQIQIIASNPQPTATPAPGAPIPVISAPAQAQVGQPVTFDAGNSQPAASIVSYAWQFGDGSTANAVSIQHTYLKSGVYNVILIVTDNQNVSSTANQQIQIAGVTLPPTATSAPDVPTPTQVPEATVAPIETPTATPAIEQPIAPTETPVVEPTATP